MKIMSKHITKRAMIALFMCALLAISTIFWEKLFGQQLDVPVVADRKPRSASTKSDKPAKVKSGNDIERRMRELIAKNQQLNPDDASLDIKTRWENAMNYDGDFMTKRDMFSSIFKTMCSEGKQFEALQLIQNSIPDSDLKDLLFTSLFNHLYLDDQLDLVKKAENKEFVKNVTSIIADRIKSINDIEKIDFLLEDKEVGSQIVNSIAMG